MKKRKRENFLNFFHTLKIEDEEINVIQVYHVLVVATQIRNY